MSTPRTHRIASLLLIPASLLALFAVAEVLFRYVLPAPDLPAPAYIDGVLRHQPGQRGSYWTAPFGQEGVRAPFSINAQGWNSARPAYPLARTSALRIAVVGDSFVEALQVPPDASLAENLERELGTDGGVEVFRYGMSGAPLSQYLHMARKAALPAHPDVLVVVIVHNDFDESYQEVPGLFTASFLKLRLDAGDTVEELPPTPYIPGLAARIRGLSATWRYLSYGRQLRFETLRRIFLHPRSDRRYEANIDISGLAAREALDRRATRYLFAQLQAASTDAGARLLLVMDGVRGAIEAGHPEDNGEGALRLNHLAAQEAEALGIPFLDLHPVFGQDFQQNHKPFGFKTDGHWNAHAHAVAARAVAARLRALNWTGGR